MRIALVEIQNFRKLMSVRIDLDERTTLCVGANNSGKTSAMLALGHFLVNPKRFTTSDFTLNHWSALNALGTKWENAQPGTPVDALDSPVWHEVLPSLDIWLDVPMNQVYRVQPLIPNLAWTGGILGVRIRFEPNKVEQLANEYLAQRSAAKETMTAAAKADPSRPVPDVKLWPKDMRDFLDNKLHSHFSAKYYLLDPSKREAPVNGIARAQLLPQGVEPLDGNPLSGMIKVNEIPAQRGLGDTSSDSSGDEDPDGTVTSSRQRLSEQLSGYYRRHLDPSTYPEPTDLEALQAIDEAQKAFSLRLSAGFSGPLGELQGLNYPGVTDPRLQLATRLHPTDSLSHTAAVQYQIGTAGDLCLSEGFNGLGYQNLISMVFRLMSFRDAWMRVGKHGRAMEAAGREVHRPPIQLVLVEEPEAYLHAQVQQVFLRKAYEVLRNRPELKLSGTSTDNPEFSTQLVVSTHSSHIAHECEFASLRYFRRHPASATTPVPVAAVINLSGVFGSDEDTKRFVTRYLRATHCDLFFADAAILLEGTAERMLVPHFIRNKYKILHCCYVTLLEVNGSHAHRLKPLIEALGLITLIISDLDSAEGTGNHKVVKPQRSCGQITRNPTLKSWHPQQASLDALLDLKADSKVLEQADRPLFAVRVAYQCPISMTLTPPNAPVEMLAKTFEEALILENLPLFRAVPDGEDIGGVTAKSLNATDAAGLSQQVFDVLKSLDKGRFALDLLWHSAPEKLIVPGYIAEGLTWLEGHFKSRHQPPAPARTQAQPRPGAAPLAAATASPAPASSEPAAPVGSPGSPTLVAGPAATTTVLPPAAPTPRRLSPRRRAGGGGDA